MIGIYGGTFDPVHYGHLRTALEVKEVFDLDEIRLIPCSQPAHRESPHTTTDMRLQMLELAIQNHLGFVVDRRELDRDGYSYMIDTLKSLRKEMPDKALFLIIGTDAFSGLADWYQWQQLFDYAHIVVITRPRYQQTELSAFLSTKLTCTKENLKLKKAGYLYFQAVTQLDISATAIRNMVAKDRAPNFLLPDNVIGYIKQNKLY
ncbi:MAG: nicotinate-nucleotide adenylyltransferase [Methylococcaceae bacterium]